MTAKEPARNADFSVAPAIAVCSDIAGDEISPLLPPEILEEFGLKSPRVEWLSGGRTNQTLRAVGEQDLVLQHMRATPRSDLLGIMENLVRVTSHLDWRRVVDVDNERQVSDPNERWYPQLVPTSSGKPFIMTEEGHVWRAFSFRPGQIVRSAQPLRTLASAGQMYGRFAAETANLTDPPLIETTPGFHNLETVYGQLMSDLEHADDRKRDVQAVLPQLERVKAGVDQRIVDDGFAEVPQRIVHNDTKLSNVLCDRNHGVAKAVLDLDLVMPGPCWHDLGDLLRSASWHAPDVTEDNQTSFTRALFTAVTGGYIYGAGESLADSEIVTFAAAGPRISLELGLRYLNDHLRDEPHLRVLAENGSFLRGIENVKLAAEMLGAYDALRLTVDDVVDTRRNETKGTP